MSTSRSKSGWPKRRHKRRILGSVTSRFYPSDSPSLNPYPELSLQACHIPWHASATNRAGCIQFSFVFNNNKKLIGISFDNEQERLGEGREVYRSRLAPCLRLSMYA